MKILDNITNTVRDDLRVEIKKGSSRSTMRVPQPDIIEHFGSADAVPQPPERCLSVRRELCGVALTLYWFPWRGAGRDAA